MKRNVFLALIFILPWAFSAHGQIPNDNFEHTGEVKSITVTRTELKNPTDQVISSKIFDLSGRPLQESSGNQITEYWYSSKKGPATVSWFRGTQNYEINTYYEDGKLHLKGELENGKVTNLKIYSYPNGAVQELEVRNGKIHSKSTTKRVRINALPFPKNLVPFLWDKSLSYKLDVADQNYSNPDLRNSPEQMTTYRFYEQGKSTNWVELIFMGNNNEMGSWYRYENDHLVEERYITSNTLSTAGQRLSYSGSGHISKIERTSGNGKKETSVFSYVFDGRKNYITSIGKSGDGSGLKISRKLLYYKAGEQQVKSILSLSKYLELSKILKSAAAKYK